MKKFLNKISIVIFVAVIFSCKQQVQQDKPDLNIERNRKKEAFIKLNRYVVKRNEDLIVRFVGRTGWNIKKTETGMWYEIIKRGTGLGVSPGDIIQYSFSAILLDGTFCDSTTAAKPVIIKVGQGGVGPGLEEAFLLLREGDNARFIIPPHLAYGNFGDGKKYPAGAIVLYNVHLLKVQKKMHKE